MANQPTILEWINFGKVSAERDDKLSEYFFDNGVLKNVIDGRSSFLVLGRKGAGKTAVFRYLTENRNQFLENDDILVSLQFEDYNWSVHSLLMNESKSQSMLYKQSWRFVILLECIKAYSAFYSGERSCPPEIKRASKLVERLFGSPIPSITEIISGKILSLSTLKLPKAGLSLEDGDFDSMDVGGGEVTFNDVRESRTLREKISGNIESIIKIFDQALTSAVSTPRLFVCFDRVDEAWDVDSFEASKKVIAGLVSACESINAQYDGRIRPVVFLREDIFEVLSINDANKLREDCGALLHWRLDSLRSMILRRVNYFASKAGVDAVNSIDSLFDRPEMRQRSKPSRYIMRRTMMRPRDLIAILGRVVDSMKEKQNDPFVDSPAVYDKLECEAVYAAEPGYSEWLKSEIMDEWGTQRPEIAKLFSAIQNNGSTNINRIQIADQLGKLGAETEPLAITDYLKFLFDNSIIGFKLGSSTEWKFKCFYPSQGFVESEEYRVHEGLVRALNLTEPRA